MCVFHTYALLIIQLEKLSLLSFSSRILNNLRSIAIAGSAQFRSARFESQSRRLIYSHAFVTVTRLRDRSRASVSTVTRFSPPASPPLPPLSLSLYVVSRTLPPFGVPHEGTCLSLYFFFFCGRPSSRARDQVSSLPRSLLFPAGPFSPLASFSRLAPGHYLIFRLETSHPQEKRSG